MFSNLRIDKGEILTTVNENVDEQRKSICKAILPQKKWVLPLLMLNQFQARLDSSSFLEYNRFTKRRFCYPILVLFCERQESLWTGAENPLWMHRDESNVFIANSIRTYIVR